MIEEAQIYRLCRVFMVNIGTNQLVPSGRITAVDPRGGAAILGGNGVGKTSMLRVVPLFFGHSPGQVVVTSAGQMSMARFYLPSQSSAIAFEYQRGDAGEEGLRLAVIRCDSSDPDTPFYRLFKCGYRSELFVADGKLLNDKDSCQRAAEFNILKSEKLTTAEYRSVILRTMSHSKKRDKLRLLSLDCSFGPRSLENLDRIVATMIKDKVSFQDLTQVAVSMVQQETGMVQDRARLEFSLGRAQIDHWLANRDACDLALKMDGEFEGLNQLLRDFRQTEVSLRECHGEVLALQRARNLHVQALTQSTRLLESAWFRKAEDLQHTQV